MFIVVIFFVGFACTFMWNPVKDGYTLRMCNYVTGVVKTDILWVPCKRSFVNSGAWLQRFDDVTRVEKSCISKAKMHSIRIRILLHSIWIRTKGFLELLFLVFFLIAEQAFVLNIGVPTMDPSTPVVDYPSFGSILMYWALSPNGFICWGSVWMIGSILYNAWD